MASKAVLLSARSTHTAPSHKADRAFPKVKQVVSYGAPTGRKCSFGHLMWTTEKLNDCKLMNRNTQTSHGETERERERDREQPQGEAE